MKVRDKTRNRDSNYNNLIESINSDITTSIKACEYLELNNSWPIESNNLLLMQLNVRGLSSKVDHITRIIDSNPCNKPPEVILLCETWLNEYSPKINIPGYRLETENRKGKKGGGSNTDQRKSEVQNKTRPHK